jgi:NADH-quinone oxidoreductase subunit L
VSHDHVILASKLILLLPLCAFLSQVLLPLSWRVKERQGDWIPTGAMGAAMILAWGIFATQVILKPHGIEKPIHEQVLIGSPSSEATVQEGVLRTFRSLDVKGLKNAAGEPCLDETELGGPLSKEANALGDGLLSQSDLLKWRMEPVRRNAWLNVGEALPIVVTNTTSAFRGGHASIRFDFGFLIDNLTSIMLAVVTTISFLVHLYSMGYMRDHHGHPAPRYGRFFAFLALFSFSMLGLVLTDNLFMLFCFWELVGVCSYFLIGFEFERPAAQVAQIKAFMTTRVGDVFFFIGIMMIGLTVGSFRFDDIFASIPHHQWVPWVLTAAAILTFIGPVGKSAQFPLHIWLPDAMEGPTPVSALIHAATMVVAGVYLVARMFPFFAGPNWFTGIGTYFDSTPLAVVAFTGGFTALFAATIALCQNDIKKVLAYSTISQLGYMILGIGVGSFSAGAFHLWTHAFFKALLFLGSGSVIHAVGTTDMREMGGLRRKMPITYWTFLIATMAISGIPFLSGFYSKEAILTQALAFGLYRGHLFILPFAMGMLTAGLTAFYMFRIIFMTFVGEPRNQERFDHAHESPPAMTVPLGVLCIFSVFSAGAFGLFHSPDWFSNRVSNAMHARLIVENHPDLKDMPLLKDEGPGMETPEHEAGPEIEAEPAYIVWPVALDAENRERAHLIPFLLSLFAATIGIGFCWASFAGPLRDEDYTPKGTWLGGYRRVLEKLYYMDDLYMWAFVAPLMRVRLALAWFDRKVIDRVVDGVGESVVWTANLTERLDRRSLGMARGAELAALSVAAASLALIVSTSCDLTALDVNLGVLGVFHPSRGSALGSIAGASAALVTLVILVLAGVSRGASATTAVLMTGAGIFGAKLGVRVAHWTDGQLSTNLGLTHLSMHPVAAGILAVAGFGLIVAWWAGLGVDGSVRWLSESLILTVGRVLRRVQTGRLQEYLFATVVGIVAIIFLVAIV